MNSYVVGDGLDLDLVQWAIQAGFIQISHSTTVCIYQRAQENAVSVEEDAWLQCHGYERLFEHCYLPSRVRGSARSGLVQALFEQIGGEAYCDGITTEKNEGCYSALFSGACSRMTGSTTRILDVGCGPGTIASSLPGKLASILVGFDFVASYLADAGSCGMRVVDEEGLSRLALSSFDILLCSFVLHYEAVSEEVVGQLVRVMRVGGIWAANFHKSRGISWFSDCLRHQGDFALESEPSRYGELLYARRIG